MTESAFRARRPSDPVVQMLTPRIYGSTPSFFGSPVAESESQLRSADVAFLGIPWRAPTPDSRIGAAASNYEGTLLTPSYFRVNSLKYGGYLPELDLDVFEHVRLVDHGDSEIVRDMASSLANVESDVTAIMSAGCAAITVGGNSGPSTYPVLKAIAASGTGPASVLNLDAHHDNTRGDWRDDDPRLPRWGSTWAGQILTLPHVDPTRYFHFGLRGPRNDREVFTRFEERGALRQHIGTYADLKRARKQGFDEWAEAYAQEVAAGDGKVWVAIDPDVMNLGSNPSWGDEPLGPTTEEVVELVFQVAKAAGRRRFGGLAFMALPYDAQTLHFVCLYIVIYALAGLAVSA